MKTKLMVCTFLTLMGLVVGMFSVSAGAVDYSRIRGSTATGANLPKYSKVITVNVVDYGADETGVNDSALAIQSALDEAISQASDTCQVKVYFPDGKYRISQTLSVYDNTSVYLSSKAVVVKGFEGGCMIKNEQGRKQGGYDDNRNIIFEGGAWDGNTDEVPCDYGFSNIRIGHARNIVFRDVEVKNNESGHHLELGGVKNVTIENCEFHGYTGVSNKEAIQLDIINSKRVFAGYDPFDDATTNNVIIQNNSFYDLARGLGSHSGVIGVYHKNITIKNNTFKDFYGAAMIMYNYKNCTISGNTMTNVGAGIDFKYMSNTPSTNYAMPVESSNIVIDDCAETIIDNNIITTRPTDECPNPVGIQLYGKSVTSTSIGFPAHDYVVKTVKVTNNTINTAYSAIQLIGVCESQIKGNTITVNKCDGWKENNLVILTNSQEIEVKENTIADYNKTAIALTDSPLCTVIKNNITGKGTTGIKAVRSTDLLISDNFIKSAAKNTTKNGMSISSASTGTVRGNTIEKVDQHGISVSDKSNIICDGNIVRSPAQNAICYASSSKGKIINSRINLAGKHGISVSGGCESLTIQSNKASNSGYNGITVSGCKKNISVTKNTIVNAKQYGISINGGSTLKCSLNTMSGTGKKNFTYDSLSTLTIGTQAGTKAVSTDNSIKLSWSKLYEANGYAVYRKAGTSGSYSRVAFVTGLSYNDKSVKAGTTYYYKVKPYYTRSSEKIYGTASAVLKGSVKEKLPAVKISVAKSQYVYTGSAIKPAVTVKTSANLKKNTDYTISYSKNTNTGKATVTLSGKGKYYGTKKITFRIVPKKAKISTLYKIAAGKFKVIWSKNTTADGYQIQYSQHSDFTSKGEKFTKNNTTTSFAISGRAKGKTYYVRVRNYKTIDGKKYYGAWSDSKKVVV